MGFSRASNDELSRDAVLSPGVAAAPDPFGRFLSWGEEVGQPAYAMDATHLQAEANNPVDRHPVGPAWSGLKPRAALSRSGAVLTRQGPLRDGHGQMQGRRRMGPRTLHPDHHLAAAGDHHIFSSGRVVAGWGQEMGWGRTIRRGLLRRD